MYSYLVSLAGRSSSTMGFDLIHEAQQAIGLLAEDVEDGLFYMDAGAGESFHFNGGLPTLLELGARAICSLENASILDAAVSWRGPNQEPVKKIVILTSKLLTDSHSLCLRVLRMHQSVRKCAIWTSVSEEAHGAHPDTSFGLDAFHDYKNSLLRELSASTEQSGGTYDAGEGSRYLSRGPAAQVPGWQVPDIELKFFPMMLCSLTKSVFVLPSGGAIAQAPLSSYEDKYAISRGLPGMEVEEPIPAGAVLLAHCLQHIVAQLDLKPEIFTLGPLANVVGKVMAGLPTPSDSVGHNRRPGGLILIDRTLDIVTPSTHGDSLLDRCFSSLPRRPSTPHTSPVLRPSVITSTVVRPPMDLRVFVDSDQAKPSDYSKVGVHFPSAPILPDWKALDISDNRTSAAGVSGVRGTPLSHSQDCEENSDLWGGSLSSSWDKRGSDFLETLVGRRTKDSVLQIRKWLQDALRQEKIEVSWKGRLGAVSVNDLRLLRRALAEKPEVAIRHTTLIQLTRAAEDALSGDTATLWDSLTSSEKILMLTAGDNTQSLALQLCDIVQQCAQNIRKAHETHSPMAADVLSLRDALTLAIVAYGLAGEGLPGINHGSPFSWEEERALKEAVVEAILKGPVGASLGFLKDLESALVTIWQGDESKKESEAKKLGKRNHQVDDDWDRWEGVDEEDDETGEYAEVQVKAQLRDKLDVVFATLHKVAAGCGRSPLREVSLPVESQITAGATLHRGLIFKVLSLAFAKMEIPGLDYHASGMGRFFKGGLGRFALRQAKPKLSDQKVLFVFVIGGLNFVEVREVREAQAAIPGAESFEVLLGGTSLLTPNDMYDLVVGSYGVP